MQIAHKIELVPNNKAKTHFNKAFGCARLAYNWGLAKWKEYYEQGITKSYLDLKKEFNAIKREEFPFVYEVSKYATQQPFTDLNRAFQKFFRDLKKGNFSYPKFKKKKNTKGSYYIGGDQVVIKNDKYINIPKFGLVKMREVPRFRGKIYSVTISREADKYYASFNYEITEAEYERTHKLKYNKNAYSLGIDVGISSLVTLSVGIKIEKSKMLEPESKKLRNLQRQLDKKQNAKTKQDVQNGVKASNNYLKHSAKIAKIHQRISNKRKDFIHKITSILTNYFKYIAIEDLNVSGMMQNHRLAKALSDVSFSEFFRQLEYKAKNNGMIVFKADRFFASSKKCSNCENIKHDLKLSNRTYVCSKCGFKIDRDLNASINLENEMIKDIGKVLPELTPVDLTALLYDLAINGITTSKVEAGI